MKRRVVRNLAAFVAGVALAFLAVTDTEPARTQAVAYERIFYLKMYPLLRSETVIIGDSQAAYAFSPEVIAKRTGTRVFNAALPAHRLTSEARALADAHLSGPGTIIVGVTPFNLCAGPTQYDQPSQWRDPQRAALFIGAPILPKRIGSLMPRGLKNFQVTYGTDGWIAWNATENRQSDAAKATWAELRRDHVSGPPVYLAPLIDDVRRWEAQGHRVIAATLPVAPHIAEADRASADFSVGEALRSLEEAGAEVVDLSGMDADFGDGVHILAPYAREASRLLAQAIKPTG